MKVLNELYTVRETTVIAITECGSIIMRYLMLLNGESVSLMSGLAVFSTQVF